MNDFPIVDLMSSQDCYEWLMSQLHPHGLKCPHCAAASSQARGFRTTKKSQVADYRCLVCDKTYNIFSKTVFEARQFTPQQAVLLLRGIAKREDGQLIANEIGVTRQTVQALRKLIMTNGVKV